MAGSCSCLVSSGVEGEGCPLQKLRNVCRTPMSNNSLQVACVMLHARSNLHAAQRAEADINHCSPKTGAHIDTFTIVGTHI